MPDYEERLPKTFRAECMGLNCPVRLLSHGCNNSFYELLDSDGEPGGLDGTALRSEASYALYGQVCMLNADRKPRLVGLKGIIVDPELTTEASTDLALKMVTLGNEKIDNTPPINIQHMDIEVANSEWPIGERPQVLSSDNRGLGVIMPKRREEAPKEGDTEMVIAGTDSPTPGNVLIRDQITGEIVGRQG